jgi:hypothetical protein
MTQGPSQGRLLPGVVQALSRSGRSFLLHQAPLRAKDLFRNNFTVLSTRGLRFDCVIPLRQNTPWAQVDSLLLFCR